MTGRQAATALAKLTWIFAIAFICTSIALTIIAARNAAGGSVIDQIGGTAPVEAPAAPALPEGNLLPPSSADAPATPPRADAPAARRRLELTTTSNSPSWRNENSILRCGCSSLAFYAKPQLP